MKSQHHVYNTVFPFNLMALHIKTTIVHMIIIFKKYIAPTKGLKALHRKT